MIDIKRMIDITNNREIRNIISKNIIFNLIID